MIKSIRGRLLLSYVVLLLVTLLLVGGGLTIALRWFYLGVQERNLTTEAQWVAAVGQEYLQNDRYTELEALTRRYAEQSHLRLTVVNSQGTVAADSNADPTMMENHAARPEIAAALQGQVGKSQRGSATVQTPFLYVAVPIVATADGRVIGVSRVAMALTDVNGAVHQLWLLVGVALFLATLLAMVFSLNLAQRITRPIEALSWAAQEVAKGNYWHRVEVASDKEIGQLGKTINHMAMSIQEKIDLISDAKEQLDFILSQMTSGVLLLNQENAVLVINPAARALLGFVGTINGQHILDVAKNIELANDCQHAMETGEGISVEIKVIYPEEKTVQADITPTRRALNARPSGSVVVLHDISQRKQDERYRAELVANVSHELKTPVTAIKGFAETLLDESGEDPAATHRFAEIIAKEANRLNLLINDLLELARIESQRIVLHKETIHIEEVVSDLLLRFRSRALEQELALTGECPAGLHAWGDKERVLQVISNFVDNAIKYTPAGGQVQIGARNLGDEVDITVTDTGIGIPAQDLPRVFERFYRVDKARSRKLGGTGLGLSIVKHLAELHNGRVWLESAVGRGTTAHFSLPKLKYVDKENGSDG